MGVLLRRRIFRYALVQLPGLFFRGRVSSQCGSALRSRDFGGPLSDTICASARERFVVSDSECVVGAAQSGDWVFFISGGAGFTGEFVDGGDFSDGRGGDQFDAERALCGEDAGIAAYACVRISLAFVLVLSFQ